MRQWFKNQMQHEIPCWTVAVLRLGFHGTRNFARGTQLSRGPEWPDALRSKMDQRGVENIFKFFFSGKHIAY